MTEKKDDTVLLERLTFLESENAQLRAKAERKMRPLFGEIDKDFWVFIGIFMGCAGCIGFLMAAYRILWYYFPFAY